MKTRHLTNQDVPMPPEYEEMMRHFGRIEGQARSKT